MKKQLLKREYRPRQVVYAPIYLSYLWNVIRSRKALYPYDANPGMPPVGLLQFSKRQILSQISEKFRPNTIFIDAHQYYSKDTLSDFVKELGHYPIIAKPDVGERGGAVSVIKDSASLYAYILAHKAEHILLQEFIASDIELGVFYYRYPNQEQGVISGITLKEFFSVTGDGKHTLRELVEQNERGIRYTDIFSEIQGDRYESIISKDEKVQLSAIGNHSKGTTFFNANYMISDELVHVFDTIAGQIDGFYYGRFDLKVKSIQDLYKGEGIAILEVNGVQSEPAHIYDPEYSLLDGIKELMHHRQVMYEISKINRDEHQQELGLGLVEHLTDVQTIKRMQECQPDITNPLISFEELIDALRQHIAWQQEVYGDINLQRCQYILDMYIGDDRRDKATFSPEHYTRYAVPMPDDVQNFDIYIMGWNQGQMSDIHNHASNGCIMRFVEGQVQEKRYTKQEDSMKLYKITTYKTGESAYIADDIGYHAIGAATGIRAVSIHVYSPAKWKTTFYTDTQTHD